MLRKVLTQASVLVLLLLAFLWTPLGAQAGGVCGGTYVVEQGETVDTIAARCGTSASAIYAANPGLSSTLYAGQVLTLPGSNYNNQGNSTIVDYNSNTYSYTYPNNYPVYAPANTSGTYIVQYGDTFSGIASRYGVSVNALWAANPYIPNINYLYAGQVLYVPVGGSYYVPAPYGYAVVSTPMATPAPLSYGSVPAGTSYGGVRLSNKSGGDVYVSLQGTTRDGVSVINEYPVSGTMKVSVPVGWYTYVAWVGGQKFTGQFNLGGDSDHAITFYNSKVVVN